jgi:hypothetical protein
MVRKMNKRPDESLIDIIGIQLKAPYRKISEN